MADVLFICYALFVIVWCVCSFNSAAWNKIFPFYWKLKTSSAQIFDDWWHR